MHPVRRPTRREQPLRTRDRSRLGVNLRKFECRGTTEHNKLERPQVKAHAHAGRV
jgi:hypothetical protein